MAEDTKELTQQPKTLKFQAPKEIEVLNASLGGVPGVDYSRMAKEIKTPEQVAVAEGELYKQMEPQRQRIAEMESEKARVDTANRAMLAEAEAEKVYSTENQRKRIYDENPYPKLNPTKENVQSLATLFSLIGVVGVGLGGRGKMSAMNSLNAMTGLMKGWQQGRADLFKRDLQEFEKSMNSVKAILDAADKEADRIYKLLPVDRARAETEMAALTASLGGQVLKQKTQLQGIEQGISFIKDLKKTSDDAYERAFKEKRFEWEKQKGEEELKIKREELKIHRERLKLDRFKTEMKNMGMDASQFINSSTGAKLKDKDAGEVLKTSSAIGHAYALKEQVAQHPEWVGRSGQIKQFFNRYLDSLATGKPLPDDDPNLAKDKSGQEALVFAKDYASYLVDYEQALAGGAKGFTVSFQNRFNKLMEQNQFNAQGFNNLMDQQIDEMARKAIVKSPSNLNKDNLTQMGLVINRDDPYATKGYQRFSGGRNQAEQQPAKPKTEAEFNALPKGQLYIDPDDGKTYRKK